MTLVAYRRISTGSADAVPTHGGIWAAQGFARMQQVQWVRHNAASSVSRSDAHRDHGWDERKGLRVGDGRCRQMPEVCTQQCKALNKCSSDNMSSAQIREGVAENLTAQLRRTHDALWSPLQRDLRGCPSAANTMGGHIPKVDRTLRNSH